MRSEAATMATRRGGFGAADIRMGQSPGPSVQTVGPKKASGFGLQALGLSDFRPENRTRSRVVERLSFRREPNFNFRVRARVSQYTHRSPPRPECPRRASPPALTWQSRSFESLFRVT